MSDSLETIKERLARQGQGQTPFTPPGADKTAAPAPSPAPAAQDIPPQVDPDIAKILASEKKAAEERSAALEAELARTKADFDALLKTQLDAVKLPSKEDLGRMEQGEALEMVLKATKAMVGEGIRGVVTDLNRNALVPIQKQLADTVIAQKREIAEEVYGSEVMRKYRPQFEDRCRRYPEIPPCDVLKSLADPSDLSQEARPTTPAPSAQAAAAAMATGISARAGGPVKPPAQKPAVADFLDASAKARASGDKFGSDEYRRAGLKERLVALGQLPPGA